MNFLEERIARSGEMLPGNVLKVDSFLNHQMDPMLMEQIGKEFHRRFADLPINKVLTIEASGIAMGIFTAREFGVPMVFAKKSRSANMDGSAYCAEVFSFTKKVTNQVLVAKRYLNEGDHVLIVDDFLASGAALDGLIAICQEAGATVEGIGIVIEKGFQEGGDNLRKAGYRLESLAIVEHMDPVTREVKFR